MSLWARGALTFVIGVALFVLCGLSRRDQPTPNGTTTELLD